MTVSQAASYLSGRPPELTGGTMAQKTGRDPAELFAADGDALKEGPRCLGCFDKDRRLRAAASSGRISPLPVERVAAVAAGSGLPVCAMIQCIGTACISRGQALRRIPQP
jgi:hypothetical protein